jgi:AraC-like DNA-binding protein
VVQQYPGFNLKDRAGYYLRTALAEVPPMQYLAGWRLQLAGRLLEQPGVSIAQAGAEVGYESAAAFNHAFKKQVGVPPGSWRRWRMNAVRA